jgi:hypothetical protein
MQCHSYEGKVKSSSLAYNRRETRDKRLLGRDLDKSLCHLHTSVKLFLSGPRKLYTCVAMTPAPARISTQRSFVPSFTLVVGTDNFSPCPQAAADVRGIMSSDQKCFIILLMWR